MFVALDGSTLLQAGVVTDMSGDGIHLRTRQPAPVGAVIEIEVEPREETGRKHPIMIRGRVVRVQELPGGEYSVGVKLRYRIAPKRSASYSENVEALPAPLTANSSEGPQSAQWQDRIRRLDWRPVAMAALFLLIIGIVFYWPRNVSRAEKANYSPDWDTLFSEKPAAEKKPAPKRSSNGIGNWRDQLRMDYRVEPLVPTDTTQKRSPDRVSQMDIVVPDGALAHGNRGELASVRYDRGEAQNETVDADYSMAPSAGSGAILTGGAGAGASRVEDMQPIGGATDMPSPAHLREFAKPARALGARTGKRGPDESPTAPVLSLSDGVHLTVDMQAYTLTVYRGGKPYTRYPISLGANGSTPKGHFTIHNKIRNPDWYNRGESVPFGDPRNPLGASWMGFAQDGEPLSYGIHPTNDLGAIGQPAGRGCVRLKPQHAEALFRLCPVGATVTIQ